MTLFDDREHPEVNEKLCEELITMQCNEVVHQGVFLCLTPWMEQLSFSPEDSEWGDRLLKGMYFVTLQHGKEFSYEIERLWTTIASKGNIRPILSFLVDFAMKECSLQATHRSTISSVTSCMCRIQSCCLSITVSSSASVSTWPEHLHIVRSTTWCLKRLR